MRRYEMKIFFEAEDMEHARDITAVVVDAFPEGTGAQALGVKEIDEGGFFDDRS